jgi:hypothetical protein
LCRNGRRGPRVSPYTAAPIHELRVSDCFSLGRLCNFTLRTQDANKNKDAILRLHEGQTEKREETRPWGGEEPEHPRGKAARTGVSGDQNPQPRTQGASCLVVRRFLRKDSLMGLGSTGESSCGHVRLACSGHRWPRGNAGFTLGKAIFQTPKSLADG